MWIVALIICLAPAVAEDGCKRTEPCTWWAVSSQADTVNISIWQPDGSIVVANDSMTERDDGLWSYDITFNSSGNYVAKSIFYQGGVQQNTATETKDVSEALDVQEISIIVGLGLLMALFMFVGTKLLNRKEVAFKGLALASYVMALLFLNYITFSMMEITASESYHGAFVGLFNIGWILSTTFIIVMGFLLFGTSLMHIKDENMKEVEKMQR
jgi:hypothetical protein